MKIGARAQRHAISGEPAGQRVGDFCRYIDRPEFNKS
jgi:hypothetical protein